MTDPTLSAIAGMTGLFLFMSLFLYAAFTAFRPKNRAAFRAAAEIPLKED